ncbi:MAG: hypothetical protein JWN67_1777 [Actinomycetia bacterium]|nr:hypothetical protein [Actinomycetes bacterium]
MEHSCTDNYSARLRFAPVGGRRRTVLVLVALALLGAAACEPVPPMPGSVVFTDGVRYGSGEVVGGRVPLLLDIYAPGAPSKARRPVVVLIHGGAFTYLDRTDDRIATIARALAKRGIVAVSIDYRLTGQQPVASTRVKKLLGYLRRDEGTNAMVCAVDDTLTAITYLTAQADKLNIDVGRLGLVGASAGAITADHVAYAIDDHGIARPPISFVGSLWGGIIVWSPTTGSNTAAMLEADEAPLFAVHGELDDQVLVAYSDTLVARARSLGVRTEYIRVPGAGHAYDETGFFTRKVVGNQTALDRLVEFAVTSLHP